MILWRHQSQYQGCERDEIYLLRSGHGSKYVMRKSVGGAGGWGARRLARKGKQFVECIVVMLLQTTNTISNIQDPRVVTYQRDDVCGLGREFVGQLFVVGNQVCDVNIAVILLYERILAELISIQY